jgi:hypothetical protein
MLTKDTNQTEKAIIKIKKSKTIQLASIVMDGHVFEYLRIWEICK